MTRRFAYVTGFEHVDLPRRKTKGSAGYDLHAAEDTLIFAGETALIPTGVKAYMNDGDVLIVALRSSLAVKRGLTLANGIGVIDADYVDNSDNEGHIFVAIHSEHATVRIEMGERVAQALFVKYAKTDDDDAESERNGGFGSTGR